MTTLQKATAAISARDIEEYYRRADALLDGEE